MIPAWETQRVPLLANAHCPGWKYKLIQFCSTENPHELGTFNDTIWRGTQHTSVSIVPHDEGNRDVRQPGATQIHIVPTCLHPVFAIFLFCASKWRQALVDVHHLVLPCALPRHIFPQKQGRRQGQKDVLFNSHLLVSQPRCCAGSSPPAHSHSCLLCS